ncbi:MAG: bifunctional diguanylate cyclase/phosphodiesterase [Dokdonella sp.]
MDSWIILQLVLFAIGAVVALIQGAIFAHYHRIFRREHLFLWALAFASLAIYLSAAGAAVFVYNTLPSPHWLDVPLSSLSLIGAYCHVVLLVAGTLAIWREHIWRRSTIISLLVLAALFGLGSALTFAWDPQHAVEKLFLRTGLRHLVTGIAALAMGVVIAWRWPRERLGQQLTALALAIYGIEQLQLFAACILSTGFNIAVPWQRYTSVIGLVTQVFIGYGLAIWLLEDERIRAEHATNAAERLRHFDPLTGLPNRQRMLEHLGRQMEHADGATLLLVRIDNLGNIAAAFGMDGIDLALTASAERIEEVARARGLFASRPGADHFALQGAGGTTSMRAGRIAEQVLHEMAQPLFWHGREIALEASIGIAVAPRDADTADALQSSAEMARARARREGAMRYRFYAPELDIEAHKRLLTQAELRMAFSRDEFVLEYQPILNGWSLQVSSFEALVRWRHPERGLLLPDAFIDELEPLGLIEQLDGWVLQRACESALRWQQPGRAPIPVAVNISAHSFQRRDFPDAISRLLERTGLAANCLELEIIESIALEHPERAIVSLESLREFGVRVMLDDFGTGFSSLKHLRQLPFDGIKIDRSFVTDVLVDPRDAAIVRAILALGHSLGLSVVAEGIETAAQLAWFQSAGCDRLQGFHFHRSMELDAAIALVQPGPRLRQEH